MFFIILREFDLKMSPLELGETLGLFINILTADGEYPFQGCENLPLPFKMRLSEKRKMFSQFFAPFRDSTSNLQHFE